MSLQVSIADIEALLLELPHPNALGPKSRERYWRLGGVVAAAQEICRNSKPSKWRLTGVQSNKVAAIKIIRSITDMGLKEAKDFVEKEPFWSDGHTDWMPLSDATPADLVRQRTEEGRLTFAIAAQFGGELPPEAVAEVCTTEMGTW